MFRYDYANIFVILFNHSAIGKDFEVAPLGLPTQDSSDERKIYPIHSSKPRFGLDFAIFHTVKGECGKLKNDEFKSKMGNVQVTENAADVVNSVAKIFPKHEIRFSAAINTKLDPRIDSPPQTDPPCFHAMDVGQHPNAFKVAVMFGNTTESITVPPEPPTTIITTVEEITTGIFKIF